MNLSKNSFVFSVSPRRLSLSRRMFWERGLAVPQCRPPLRVSTPTRSGEPKAYSGLALNFIEALFLAYRKGWSYVLFFEDDATPCDKPQERLSAFLAENPLPDDCGILALGDINGASRYRGRQTLLLKDCAPAYTPLVPGRAENKGSHALCIFRQAMMPFCQAIIECGVTDLAISRISRYCGLRAFGLFHLPLFMQRRDGAAHEPSFRSAEAFMGAPASLRREYPPFSRLTRFHPVQEVRRFFVFSNAPQKDLSSLVLGEKDVAVLLNRAADRLTLGSTRKMLFARHNANRPGTWFLPEGSEDTLSDEYEDFLLPQDSELAKERLWFREYREQTGLLPSSGWVAWKMLQEDFPEAEVILVDFDPAGDIGTFKWSRHAWHFEAQSYREGGAKIISCRSF